MGLDFGIWDRRRDREMASTNLVYVMGIIAIMVLGLAWIYNRCGSRSGGRPPRNTVISFITMIVAGILIGMLLEDIKPRLIGF